MEHGRDDMLPIRHFFIGVLFGAKVELSVVRIVNDDATAEAESTTEHADTYYGYIASRQLHARATDKCQSTRKRPWYVDRHYRSGITNWWVVLVNLAKSA